MDKKRWLVLLGAVALIVGSLMPWGVIRSAFGSATISGIEGDGLILIVLGGVILLIALLRDGQPGKTYSVGAVLLSLLAALISFAALVRISGVSSESSYVSASVGGGIFVCLLGSAVSTVGAASKVDEEEDKGNGEEED